MTKISTESNKCLFDTNVIIDALVDRTNEYNYSKFLISLVLNKKIKACLCVSQITDIYYILRKYLPREDRLKAIRTILNTFTILPLLNGDLFYCINSKIKDYEDAILDEVASVNCVNTIVTNNKKDFIESKNIIISPKELYQLMSIDVGE